MYFHVNEYDFIIFFSMPMVNLYIFANQDKIDFFLLFGKNILNRVVIL